MKEGSHILPEGFLGADFFEDRLKQRTTELLSLIGQESLCGAHGYVA